MKLTKGDRLKIKAWAEKDKEAETQLTPHEMTLEDGTSISLSRVTTYMPNGKWKVRTAYLTESGRPVFTTGPIPSQNTSKNDKQESAHKHTLFQKGSVAIPEDVLQHYKTQMAAQMKAPSPYLWDHPKNPAQPDDYVTFDVKKPSVLYLKNKHSGSSYGYLVGQTVSGQKYHEYLIDFTVPTGYHWVKANSNEDLYTLVEK